ncbi:MAG: signal recognition particle protein [bacterium]
MFESLSEKFELLFKKLRGMGKITERNIQEAMREVRIALLEADVNFRVVKDFVRSVTEKAVGQEVLASITPGQKVIKIVHDELVRLMGETQSGISYSTNPPTVIMLVGLQGSGKTTVAGKLARFARREGRKPVLVAADVYRPAADYQLEVLGGQLDVPVFSERGATPVEICRRSVEEARSKGWDVVIIDTAGRLHIDAEMMKELKEIKSAIHPHEILLVADAMTGQDAVNTASQFNADLGLDGVILTKLDGDARGGAALSIRAVVDRPIKFVGVGEKLDALEPFYPDRMASRILGMGDILSLVERAEEAYDEKRAQELERKMRRAEFDLEDFLEQLRNIKRMGPLDRLLDMIPGAGGMKDIQVNERDLVKSEAIICSMTREERRHPQIIDGSRRRRIAQGSGTTVKDVNRLLNQYRQMQKMIKSVSRMMKGGEAHLPF